MSITYDPPFVVKPRAVIGFSFDSEVLNDEIENGLTEEGFKVKALPDAWSYTSKTCERRGGPGKWLEPHRMNFMKYMKSQTKRGEEVKMVLPFIKEGEIHSLPYER